MKSLRPLLFATVGFLFLAYQPVHAQLKDRPLPESPGESRNAPTADQTRSKAKAAKAKKMKRAKAARSDSTETK